MQTPARPDNTEGVNREFKKNNGRKPTKQEWKFKDLYGKFPTTSELKQYIKSEPRMWNRIRVSEPKG